jgi:pilus assembly protein FimV
VLEKIEERYADLTDLDEQETKLDLAKAYVDMGDEAAAREILEDVLQKGNEAQKTEARTRRDKLMKN